MVADCLLHLRAKPAGSRAEGDGELQHGTLASRPLNWLEQKHQSNGYKREKWKEGIGPRLLVAGDAPKPPKKLVHESVARDMGTFAVRPRQPLRGNLIQLKDVF